MLIDLSNAVGSYLHDVFIGNLDWGILIGYIAQALQAYKSGARANATMRAIAATLNEKEIAALAAYYGGMDTKTAASK